jgi:hypothetical protein
MAHPILDQSCVDAPKISGVAKVAVVELGQARRELTARDWRESISTR